MKKCSACGKEFPDEFVFCDNCGAMLEKPAEPTEEPVAPEVFTIPDAIPAADVTPAADAAEEEAVPAAAAETEAAEEPNVTDAAAEPAEPTAPAEPEAAEEAPPAHKKEKRPHGKKKTGKKTLLIAAVAAVVIIALVIVLIVCGGGKKNKGLPLAGKSLGLYLKDGEITFTNLSGKSVQMTEKLAKQDDNRELLSLVNNDYFCRFSSDGKYLFFPDKLGSIRGGDYDLYMKAVNDTKGTPKKIGTNVSNYQVSPDSKFVVFRDGNDKLMLYTIGKDSCETIAKKVNDYYVSQDYKNFLYKSDGTWYLLLNGKDKEKMGDGTLCWHSDDFKTVVLLDEDTLITKTAGKDKEKLAKDVYGRVTVIDLKHIYYVGGEYGNLSICYYDGKESTELVEKIDSVKNSCFNKEKDIGLYFYLNSKDKLTCAMVSGGKLVMEDSLGKTDGIYSAGMHEDSEFYVVSSDHKLQTYKLSKKGFEEGSLSLKDVGYVTYISGHLISRGYEKDTLSVDDEVLSKDCYRCYYAENCIYYGDDYSAKHGTYALHKWENGKVTDITDDVYAMYCSAYIDGLYYFTNYDDGDNTATLNSYIGGKLTEGIAEEIYLGAGYTVTPDGGFLYLSDYSTKKYEGDLYYYNGKKCKKLDEDVCAILRIS